MTVMAQEAQSIAGERLRPTVRNLWLRCYPDYEKYAFEQQIASLVTPEMNVLEIGAGSGRGSQNVFELRGSCARYAGVDVDPRVLENPHLDEAFVADAAALPFEDRSFDPVFHKKWRSISTSRLRRSPRPRGSSSRADGWCSRRRAGPTTPC